MWIKRSCSLLALAFFISSAAAQNKVVVIPMSGDDLKPLGNVISVGTSNGDFDSPIAALASITDASASKPYLVVIAPGVYQLGEVQLQMKPYVDVVGSGQNVTTLISQNKTAAEGAFLSDGVGMSVLGSANSSIKHLAIENTSSGDYSGGIFNDFNAVSAISYVSITALSPTGYRFGINNNQSPAGRISDVSVKLSGVSSINIGIQSVSGSMIISDSLIDVSGVGSSTGVYFGSNGGDVMRIISSTIIGNAPHSVERVLAPDVYISDSILQEPTSGSPKCSFVFGVNGEEYNDACFVLPPI